MVVLAAFHGYRFGDQDLNETLSYALKLRDPQLYPGDLYIDAISSTLLNERLPFTLLLALVPQGTDCYALVLHTATTFLLLWGFLRIACRYLAHPLFQLAFLLISLLPLYHLNLGGNEVWYNYLVPSQVSKSIGVWSIVFYLERRYLWSFLVLIPCTLFQPIVGAQLLLIIFLLLAWEDWDTRKLRWRQYRGLIVYTLTAGIWVLSVFVAHVIADDSVSDSAFYAIMETRLAHHFFPSYYPGRSYLLLLPLFALAWLVWRNQDKRLQRLYTIAAVGMVLYTVAIEWIQVSHLLGVQWFKITVWLKPLSVLAILAWLEQRPWCPTLPPWSLSAGLAITGLICILQFRGVLPLSDRPMYYPWRAYHTDEWLMAAQIKEKLPKDACLILPPVATAIRYQSERCIYLDYKSNVHSKRFLAEMSARRTALYGIGLQQRQARLDPLSYGTHYFEQLNEETLVACKRDGATHVLMPNSRSLTLKKVLSNATYSLYEL